MLYFTAMPYLIPLSFVVYVVCVTPDIMNNSVSLEYIPRSRVLDEMVDLFICLCTSLLLLSLLVDEGFPSICCDYH